MFGYLKPYKEELKIKEIKQYKRMYCTVCYGLRKNMGFFYSAILNYEAVFLYIILDSVNNSCSTEQTEFRCPLNPLKKTCIHNNKELLEYVSFINYYLMLLKIRDNYYDKHWKIYKVLLFFLEKNNKYKTMLKKYSSVVEKISEQYETLYHLENSEKYTFDDCSATMGNVLREIVLFYLEKNEIVEDKKDILELSNHLGRWVYLIDAYDDYEKDIKSNQFNPLNEFKDNHNNFALKAAETMLKMMLYQIKQILENITLHNNMEIISNILIWGSTNSFMCIYKRYNQCEKTCECNKKNV